MILGLSSSPSSPSNLLCRICRVLSSLGLGISPEGFFKSELESRGLSFETGDVFLFVTDGVTEARDAQGREFGEERLVDLLHAAAQRDAAGILQSVLDAVDAHAGGRERHDDQTVVVVKASRNGSPP